MIIIIFAPKTPLIFHEPPLLSVCRTKGECACRKDVWCQMIYFTSEYQFRPAKRREAPACFSSCDVLTHPPNVRWLVSSISGLSFSQPQRGNWVIIQQRKEKKEGPVPVINTRHVSGGALGSAVMDFCCSQPEPDCSWSLGALFLRFAKETSGLKTSLPPPSRRFAFLASKAGFSIRPFYCRRVFFFFFLKGYFRSDSSWVKWAALARWFRDVLSRVYVSFCCVQIFKDQVSVEARQSGVKWD